MDKKRILIALRSHHLLTQKDIHSLQKIWLENRSVQFDVAYAYEKQYPSLLLYQQWTMMPEVIPIEDIHTQWRNTCHSNAFQLMQRLEQQYHLPMGQCWLIESTSIPFKTFIHNLNFDDIYYADTQKSLNDFIQIKVTQPLQMKVQNIFRIWKKFTHDLVEWFNDFGDLNHHNFLEP